jgi:hypothetical protein
VAARARSAGLRRADAGVLAAHRGGRRFELHTIAAASAVKTSWLAGWGIRLTPQGWLYNAWGRGAVRLQFAGGRRFTIGTDEPEALLAAIERAREELRGA